MPKDLVIVESPAKAKTIEGYLGHNYKVVSCYGHIRDLPKRGDAIDVEHGFLPTYEISEDKQDVVENLRRLSAKAPHVYLASDDDREGESIAWHLQEALGLTQDKTRRIVFREITKRAILNAIEHPRSIDLALVNSQQARRLLDRLVGYDLSPVLWKKIKRGLSAGRVQSVAVRMIVEREREVHAFVPESSYKVTAYFPLEEERTLEGVLEERLPTPSTAQTFLEMCVGAQFSIKEITKSPAKRSPLPPFTTSTLQQEAGQRLGYSVTQTMALAQRLYEEGKISYMRTDSVHLSPEAVEDARKAVEENYGKAFFKARVYKTKSANAQEAHEAIRPTDFSKNKVSDDSGAQRLYTLIWQRAMASQMADALLEKTTAEISISTSPKCLVARGEVITFKGFLAVYSDIKEDASAMLPPIHVGQKLNLNYMEARERFTKPPARYTEPSLVKQLEEQGIGRPSTYAPTIATIQKRGYVTKESRPGKERQYTTLTLKQDKITPETYVETVGTEKNKLFPTDIAMLVNDFLVAYFPNITDYGFTAQVEEKLDEIAHNGLPWNAMLGDFYRTFKPQVEKTEAIDREVVNTKRVLGKDPATGKPVVVRIGKYGPLVQIGDPEEEEKPRFASLGKDQLIEKITLEEALELFKLPREVGVFEGAPMLVNKGRFGPYVRHLNAFYSLRKDQDPFDIDAEEATSLIKAKREADANRIVKTFDEDPTMQLCKGRWGIYLKADRKNIKIPKGVDPLGLTFEDCKQLMAAQATVTKKSAKGNTQVKKTPSKAKKTAKS